LAVSQFNKSGAEERLWHFCTSKMSDKDRTFDQILKSVIFPANSSLDDPILRREMVLSRNYLLGKLQILIFGQKSCLCPTFWKYKNATISPLHLTC
jgi:hypothetical protein